MPGPGLIQWGVTLLGHRFEDVLGAGFPTVGLALVHGVNEYRFDRGSGELFAGAGNGGIHPKKMSATGIHSWGLNLHSCSVSE